MKEILQAREKNGEQTLFPYVLALVSIVWLPFGLGTAVVKAFQAHYSWPHLAASIVGAAIFMGIYLWGVWDNTQAFIHKVLPTQQRQIFLWVKISVLLMLSLILVIANGYDWMGLFFFTCAYVSSSLSGRQAIWTVIGLTLGTTLFARIIDANLFDVWSTFFLVGVIGLTTTSMVRFYRIRLALQRAEDEIARMAVVMERMRIARDLHDLLGHNLSLIALKSELAGRLISVAPERAVNEIADVEQVARTTLQEVREAVGNYRQATLANELESAREMFAAAGVTYQCRNDAGDVPGTVEALLAWGVREGVTNVIRHSRARTCTIHITRVQQKSVRLEIINDSADCAAATLVQERADDREERPTGSKGNGLRGLKERVEELNGYFEAAPDEQGGFRLVVSVLLTQRAGHLTLPQVTRSH